VVVRPVDLDDDALVGRCVAGDQEAWSTFVDRYARYVHAIIARGYRLSGHDAEDVFQDVFARAFERLPSLREPAAVQGWVAQLTRNACVDRLRSAERVSATDADLAATAIDETVAELDLAMDVHRALGQLPEQCGDVLDRFFARDQSYATIAEETGLAMGTIASRVSRCLTRLRELLGES
jgi:RNA polymerase sigma-70 factor (ECF subfamily)